MQKFATVILICAELWSLPGHAGRKGKIWLIFKLCFSGVSGIYCEEHSYGFQELSFLEFPPLDHRTNIISLEFATVQRNSLLLHNHGGSSSREFFALEILDGAIHLSYDLGSGPVRLQTNKQVSDGYFHSVITRRIGNVSLQYVSAYTRLITFYEILTQRGENTDLVLHLTDGFCACGQLQRCWEQWILFFTE